MSTQRQLLQRICAPSDVLSVTAAGILDIDGCSATALLREFGSPLFVVAEKTLRANLRRIRTAFADRWPAPVNVMYAIKANNNPAVRAILHSEGAGGECFGMGELHATFLGGANPDLVAMNGSSKTEEELSAAVSRGVFINIDAEQEVEMLAGVCKRLNKSARVNLRLKISPESYSKEGSDYFGLPTNVKECLDNEKWGFSAEAAPELIQRIRAVPSLQMKGFSAHTGRFTRQPGLFRDYTRALADTVVRLWRSTGFKATVIDVGGGWPRMVRDPESRALDLNPHAIETYAEQAVAGLREGLDKTGFELPELWVEPGRYIVGNAVLLLGTIGTIKRDCGRTWVHSDFSTNNLMRIDTAGSAYHVVVAAGMDRDDCQQVQLVGPTCIDSRIAGALKVPDVAMGEPLAVLDAGMYAETTSTQFNGVPRPATVLVADGRADIIKQRETVEDLFRLSIIPQRLDPSAVPSPAAS